MKGKGPLFLLLGLMLFSPLFGENPEKEKPKPQAAVENPIAAFTQAMMDRLSTNFKVKNVVGEPVKVGKVTIIPIMMIDIGYGGGGGGLNPGMTQQAGGQGFFMSGEARPLGFIVISKTGTRFVSVGKVPQK